MPDVLVNVPATKYKIRCRIIRADNHGPTLEQKSSSFFVGIYSSNADGSQVGVAPLHEIEHTYPVPALLADPETSALAVQALQALEALGAIMCERHKQALIDKLSIATA
jgi:hypothetical protein